VRSRGEWLAAGRVISAVLSLAAALALSGCGASGRPAPAGTNVKSDPARAANSPTFVVAGDHPVLPNGSQDTYAATPGAACDNAELAKDVSAGRKVAAGFTFAGFPTAAALLGHFLDGKGTEIDYRAGSSISKSKGRYVGTLTYVIRDSYGFPAGETLGGFGPPMRYLQTVCGAPQHAGGAHWFPDTITVTVPFDQPGQPGQPAQPGQS
jgi:hypothetical protein